MTFYDKSNQKFIFNNVLENEKGTFFLDNCSDKLLKQLGILKVDEPSFNPNYQIVEYSEVDGIYKGRVVDIKPQAEYEKEQLINEFKNRVQTLLDEKARQRGYDDIVSACSYAGYENEFQAEAVAFGKWRAKVWKWGYALLMEHKNDETLSSLSIDELLKDMPSFEI